jgi:trk system potassium uptake protein TrkH
LDIRPVFNTIGVLVIILGLLMLVPMSVSFCFHQNDVWSFFVAAAISVGLGILIKIASNTTKTPGVKESFAIVTLGWIIAAAVGALPFVIYKACPTYHDAFFEAMSGLTTTGATVIENVDAQPNGILLWRSLLHWLGGMGIIVLFIAVLPGAGSGGSRLFKAEVPGPLPERIVPRIKESAKTLWLIYVGFTVAEIILLCMAGMNLFDSVNHAFATMATGGFSTKAASIGAWANPGLYWIITVFMFLAGINFTLYFQASSGRKLKVFFQDSELKLYFSIILVAITLITANLYLSVSFQSFREALRHSCFQVVSVITTTGFSTVDFNMWPPFSKVILIILMLIGGCAGSTAGAIKVSRILALLKHGYKESFRFIYPRAVTLPKINGSPVSRDTLNTITAFFFLYLVVFAGGSLIMTGFGLDLVSACSAVAATLGNVGPGLMAVGPAVTYHPIPAFGKWVLSACMLLGRLELFTVLVLFIPDFWRKG